MKQIIIILIIISAIIGYLEYKDYNKQKNAQEFVTGIMTLINK